MTALVGGVVVVAEDDARAVECVTESVVVLVAEVAVAGAVEWLTVGVVEATGAVECVGVGLGLVFGVVVVVPEDVLGGVDVVPLVIPEGLTPPTIDGAKFSACILLISVVLYGTPAPNTLLPKSVLDTLL